jgi:hypothetical protein
MCKVGRVGHAREQADYEQYQWALRGLSTRNVDKKMKIAY